MTTQEMTQAAKSIAHKPAVTATLPDIQKALQGVEQIMFDVVDTDVTTLRDASRHILEAGGKRIRPRLVLLSYAATGGDDYSRVIPPAAAVELVHTASVVHDDINDHGVVRRGRPSVNSIWGRTFALLTGDFLFTKVYELMGPYGDLNIILAEATVALVEGETLQASAVKEQNFTREVYLDIIGRKTAALFRSGAMLGAKLTNTPEEQVEALADFGYNIGLAFQIVDDILDLTGDESQLGKTAGLDLQQGKGFAAVADKGSNHLESIKQKMFAGDRIEKARMQAKNLAAIAISRLDVLPESEYRSELKALAESVVDRDF